MSQHYTKEKIFKAMGIPYGLSVKKKTGTITRKVNKLPDHIKVKMKNDDYKLWKSYHKKLKEKNIPERVINNAKKEMMGYFYKNKYKDARDYFNKIIK